MRVFGRHINLISDGSMVTSGVTFCKYMGYVIATRKKPYFFIYEAQYVAFQRQFIRQYGIYNFVK